ncbi:hypothetical protein V6N13_008166 [Hibiscus sabdariffa]|uniref:Uncharacterized protein n=1 Tax=Hibiscus sabdariffa TaxID=183260 RepID=A0ABR2ECD6_9ROSI
MDLSDFSATLIVIEAYSSFTFIDASSSSISPFHAIVAFTKKPWILDYILINREVNSIANFPVNSRSHSDESIPILHDARASYKKYSREICLVHHI